MAFDTLEFKAEDGVATIKINRNESPDLFNSKLRLELIMALTSAHEDEEIRVVIISGGGVSFIPRVDSNNARDLIGSVEEKIIGEYRSLCTKIHSSGKIHIAEVYGGCAGIGCAFVLSCDFIVMAEDTYLSFSSVSVDLLSDMVGDLINALGYRITLELMVGGGELSAKKCQRLGIVNQVVPAFDLTSSVRFWADEIAKNSAAYLKFSKSALQKNLCTSIDRSISSGFQR